VNQVSLILSIIKKEKPRNEYMRKYYKEKIASLPKGVIVEKQVGNHTYYYLKYRRGSKVITDYIGKESEKADEIRMKVEKRKHFEAMLSELNKEYEMIEKMLEAEK